MFCSGCGQALTDGQAFCPQCGRPVNPAAPAGPPAPSLELEAYRSNVRTLAVFWFVYAGVSLLLAFFGLAFARIFMNGELHGWVGGPMFGRGIMRPYAHFPWLVLPFRAVLAVVVGSGLLRHTPWGRILAIVAGVIALVHFPFGTAIGVWTLILLLGYRNSTLYAQM